jgi:hypothetical protein
VFVVYNSVTSNISSVKLQFMAIELDKGFSILSKAYADYADMFNPNETAKL